MRIAFRVDASAEIGTGHFMRCLTLAEELARNGSQVRFLVRQLPDPLRGMLAEKGCDCVSLEAGSGNPVNEGPAHSHWLKASHADDAQDCMRALADPDWDCLVVDHYSLDARWESAMRPFVRQILVIDDLADRKHDCDVLVDQNLYADMHSRYEGKVPGRCCLLLGPRYALLRGEFREIRGEVKVRDSSVKRLLVFFGGVDSCNYTGLTIEILADCDTAGLQVDVVIGALHPHRSAIESACTENGFTCHVQTKNISGLMAEADLSVGAGGSAVWERCCMGLPSLTICTAENQKQQVEDAALGGLLYAPEMQPDARSMIKRHLISLFENPCLRQQISQNALQAVDGRGVIRVRHALSHSSIGMRVAEPKDSAILHEWRNHESIRNTCRDSGTISWETHQKWLASVLASQDRLLLIGESANGPVGVVRLDLNEQDAEVSIYLVPGRHAPGVGGDLLRRAELWLAANRPEILRVRAHVLGSNERSRNLFSGQGYQIDSVCYLKSLLK
ncbi:MAG: UDP-2,4-diacetamido-2,4,6-trideoxy-beta-L-altropyranose hydrolase [Verrucomicrobiota bacterium]